MSARPIMPGPDAGIPDLIRRLTEDSKRLMQDEVQLAKLETKESLSRAARGALWMGLAFGAGVVMLVALTLLLVTLIGRAANGHMWVGALVVGIAELVGGFLLLKRGLEAYAEPSYTLEHSRRALRDTASWASSVRR